MARGGKGGTDDAAAEKVHGDTTKRRRTQVGTFAKDEEGEKEGGRREWGRSWLANWRTRRESLHLLAFSLPSCSLLPPRSHIPTTLLLLSPIPPLPFPPFGFAFSPAPVAFYTRGRRRGKSAQGSEPRFFLGGPPVPPAAAAFAHTHLTLPQEPRTEIQKRGS